MLKFSLLMLALVASTNDAFAWKETGGGDEIGLEFRNAFATALRAVKDGTVKGSFSAEALEKAASTAHVLVVEEPLSVSFAGTKQDSVAVNIPAEALIKVNRFRWSGLKAEKLKEAVALHEVLSLIGVERTGYYEISARYLEQAGLSGWLVSGVNNGRVERPANKTLTCQFTYLPPMSRSFAEEELFTFSEKLKEEDTRDAKEFSARRTWTTKNGRFEITATAIQPFRTAYNPAAYESVRLTLEDKQLNAMSFIGPMLASDVSKNESDAYLFHRSGRDKSDFVMLSAKCSLN